MGAFYAGRSSREVRQPAIRASYTFDVTYTVNPKSTLIVLYRTNVGAFGAQNPASGPRNRFDSMDLSGITRRLAPDREDIFLLFRW